MHLSISLIDLAIIGVYLLAVMLLGLWIGRGNRDLSDYLLGSRDLPWWALLGSIVATETSTATFLSVPGLAFAEGGDLRFLQLALGFIVGRILVARLLLPAYFAGKMFTAYEVLHRRFGSAAQRFASVLFLVARNVGDGLRLYLTALALQLTTGLPLVICVIVIAAVTIVYTLFGGMKSVVWNDCLQLLVYMTGGIVTVGLLVAALPGGWSQLQTFAVETGRLHLFDFSTDITDAHTFWAGLFGGAFLSLGSHGTDQMIVQRLLSARNQNDARKALILSGVAVFVQFALFLLIGIGLAAFFEQFPPQGAIDKPDAAFGYFIVNHMPVGITGLTLAAVFAAAMSTLSSSLNSSAAALVSDFSNAATNADMERRQLYLGRLCTVGFGIVQSVLAIVAARLSGSVVTDALAIAGFTAGALLGVFALGMFNRTAGQWAAILGMLAGLLVLIEVKFQLLIPSLPAIAWPWYPIIGSVTTYLVGSLFGLFLPRSNHQESV